MQRTQFLDRSCRWRIQTAPRHDVARRIQRGTTGGRTFHRLRQFCRAKSGLMTTTTSRRLVEFFSTVLGAVVVALLIPDPSGVLLMLITIVVALYRLLKNSLSS